LVARLTPLSARTRGRHSVIHFAERNAQVNSASNAREGRLTQIAIAIVDRPGQLAAVSALLAEAGANIIEVSHQRTFSDLPAKGTLLEVVIETRDRAHLEDLMKRLGEAGFIAWLPGRR